VSSRRVDWEHGGQLARKVLAREPDNFMALAIEGVAHSVEAILGYREIAREEGEAGLAAVSRAVELNDLSDFAHVVKSILHLYYSVDLEGAKREAERALELNPYHPLAMHHLGNIATFSGDPDTGFELCEKAMNANSRMPMNHFFAQGVATANFGLEQYGDAVAWAKRSDQLGENMVPNLLLLTTSAQRAAMPQLAAAAAKRLLERHPELTLGALRRWPFRDETVWRRFVDGLRGAGLPDL